MKHYSRRELYALGEPLGKSVTQAKVGGGRIYGGGGSGGGSPAPQTSTSYQTNLPEYAKPYVETMLGAAQKQAYKYDDAGNVVGFQPYVPYGATVGPGGQITNTAQEQAQAAVAPFSPMQERAFQQTANLQVPGQFALGTGYQALGGIGALNAGQQYMGMATNPFAQQAFMSPYMQNVVDVQKNEALRDAQMRNIGANLGAARQGTYGGARQLLAEQERNRNLQTQLGTIQAQGSQEAFKAAQQAQQFGANLGLQGMGQAVGAGTALGQMGGQQLQAQQGIIGLQSQAGAQQQALEQQRINQAIQNYALQQQYPQLQLSTMSALTRGLPLQQATTQQYQAAPSAISQIGGLGAAGVGLYGMGRSAGIFGKEGGHVKKLASGGVTGMSKKVLLNPEDFSTQQVKNMTDKGIITKLVGAPVLDAKMKDEQRMMFAQAAQQPRPIDTIAADIMARAAASQGIDNAKSNLPEFSAFDGGIIAMANGGEIDEDGVTRFQTGGRSIYIDKDDEGYYLPGVPTSQFGRDIRGIKGEIKDFYKRKISENILQPLADIRGYFSDKAVVPSAAPVTAPVDAPPEPAKPRILEDSKPSAAAPAAPTPSVVDKSSEGLADIIKKFQNTLSEGKARDIEDKKMAFYSTLAQFGLGAMGGTSPSGFTNIGQAGAPAVASGMQQLREIQGRGEKRGIVELQAALEGEKIKADYAKLGIMEPYYRSAAAENIAKADYYKKGGGRGNTGFGIPAAVSQKMLQDRSAALSNPMSSPIFKSLDPTTQKFLEKADRNSPSYKTAMTEFIKAYDMEMNRNINFIRAQGSKSNTALPGEEN